MPDTVGVNVSQFTPSTQVLSPLETPPAAVAVQVTGCEVGVIVPEVGLAAPSRITLSRRMKLATKNPPAKIHRIFFIERLPGVESDAGSSVAASAPRECFRSSVDAALPAAIHRRGYNHLRRRVRFKYGEPSRLEP